MFFIFFTLAILLIVYKLGARNHNFFQTLGIPGGPKPWPWIGNLIDLYRRGTFHDDDHVKKYGRVFGYFEGTIPIVFVADNEIIKDITIKQFDKFMNRRVFFHQDELDDSIGDLRDEDWKRVRSILTPSFTTAKLKKITTKIDACAFAFVQKLKYEKEDVKEIDAKSFVSKLVANIATETLLGVKIDDDDSKLRAFVKQSSRIFEDLTLLNPFVLSVLIFPSTRPILSRLLRGVLPGDSMDFFSKQARKILETRRSCDDRGDDMLQLLIDARSNEQFQKCSNGSNGAETSTIEEDMKEKTLNDREILANIIQLYLASYQNVTMTLSWLIYSLALHQDVQEKLLDEIDHFVPEGEPLTYDTIVNVEYLNCVINETLRLYSPSRTDRICKEDCQVGPYKFVKGVVLYLCLKAVHQDPIYWPEPRNFDPDRFSNEKKKEIRPCTFLSFGAGPRNCIGKTLALIELKIIVIRLIQHFRFECGPNTTMSPKFMTVVQQPVPTMPLRLIIKRR